MAEVFAACNVCRMPSTVMVRLRWFTLRMCNRCWGEFLAAIEKAEERREKAAKDKPGGSTG